MFNSSVIAHPIPSLLKRKCPGLAVAFLLWLLICGPAAYAQDAAPQWIKAGGCGDHVYLRKTFTLDHAPESAALFLSVRGTFRAFINGVPAAQSPGGAEWDVARLLRPGGNVLAVEAAAPPAGNACAPGLFARLDMAGAPGVVSGPDWKSWVAREWRRDGDVTVYDARQATHVMLRPVDAFDDRMRMFMYYVPWDQWDYDDAAWASAEIAAGEAPAPGRGLLAPPEFVRPVSATGCGGARAAGCDALMQENPSPDSSGVRLLAPGDESLQLTLAFPGCQGMPRFRVQSQEPGAVFDMVYTGAHADAPQVRERYITRKGIQDWDSLEAPVPGGLREITITVTRAAAPVFLLDAEIVCAPPE